MVHHMSHRERAIIWTLVVLVIAIAIILSFPIPKESGASEPATTTIVVATTTTTLAPTTTSTSTTSSTSTSTTTTEPIAPANLHCSEHYAEALRAGWTPEEWPMLSAIMHRESRCDPTVHNDSYLRGGRDNSYGLLQINLLYHDYWVLPQLQNHDEYLFDPYTNLEIGHQLYSYIKEHGGCGWSPWRMPCN